MIKAIGIDPSLSGTGLYYCEDFKDKSSLLITTKKDSFKSKDELIIKNKAKKQTSLELVDRFKREYKIYKDVLTFLIINKPNIICIEGYAFMGSNLAVQAEVMGIIGLAINKYLLNNKCDLFVITPQAVKKYITGKGSGKKQMIIKEVYKKYNIDIDNDNIADAYVISQIASDIKYIIKNKKFRNGMLSYEKEVFKGMFSLKDILKNIKQ